MANSKNIAILFAFLVFLSGCATSNNQPHNCDKNGHIWGEYTPYINNNDCSSVSVCAACNEQKVIKHSSAHEFAPIKMANSPDYMYKCIDCSHSYTTIDGISKPADYYDISGLEKQVVYSGGKLDSVEDGSCDYLAGINGVQCRITFNFLSTKSGKAKFFICAAAAAKGEVTTWAQTFPTMLVNGKNYTSNEKHHQYSSSHIGAIVKYYDYYHDFVLEIDVKKGNNVIILDSGENPKNQFNIKSFRFVKDYSMSLRLVAGN